MALKKIDKKKEPLIELLNLAEKHVIVELVLKLAISDNSIRRECLDNLKEKVKTDKILKKDAESSSMLSLKSANLKRPAFQEEFSKVFPEWEELK